jgi:hypothetical protein
MGRPSWKKVLPVLILGTLLPIVDVGTDLYTSISLFVEGHVIWGTLILSFMWTPAILFLLNQRVLFRTRPQSRFFSHQER